MQVLHPDVENEVVDFLEEVPETDPYNVLKTAILKIMGQLDEQIIQELFNNISLSDSFMAHERSHQQQ